MKAWPVRPSSTPIQVGHLYGGIQRCGGVERVLVNLLVGIDQAELKQSLLLLRRSPEAQEHEIPEGVTVFPPRRSTAAKPGRSWWLRWVREVLVRIRLTTHILLSPMDIVHIHRGTDRSHALTAFLARLTGIRVVRTVHSDPSRNRELGSRFWTVLLRSAVDIWVVLAPEHRRSLVARGISENKIRVIPNGIDVATFRVGPGVRSALRQQLAVPTKALVLLAVARLDLQQKDFGTLLDAFRLVLDRIPNAYLWIAGEGSGLRDIQRMIAAHRLAERVSMLGHRSDVPSLMASADILCFSTFCEGLGLTAVEAMAAGLPIVASDVGGLRFVLDDGQAGILVPPRDSEAMAQALIRLAEDEPRRGDLAARGRARVAGHFEIGAMVSGYLEVYRALLERRC